jgi:quinol monooxygenase YgiN
MDGELFFIVELAIKPDQVDDFRNVMDDMARVVLADEPGTRNYEWFISDDGTACYIFERYSDPVAVAAHTATFPDELSQRGRAFLPVRLTAYGKLTDEIRAKRSTRSSRPYLGST